MRNTDALLKSLGVARATLVAHSTGGMIATRYALMLPQAVQQLVLVDPLGLEDWQAKGVPAPTVDEWTRRELGQTADKIRDYERQTYYVGRWKPEYERWVDMLAGLQQGPGRELVARNSALIYDMIQTPARGVRVPAAEGAHRADDRHARHHGHRQRRGAARREGADRPLRRAGARGGPGALSEDADLRRICHARLRAARRCCIIADS